MSLKLEEASAWLHVLRSFQVRSGLFEDEDAVDAYLDERDAEPFDGKWSTAHDVLASLLEALPAQQRDDVTQLQGQAREQAYLTVIQQTDSSELAAYASDDVGLIIGCLALGHADAFVAQMRKAYEGGEFPA
ncbi:hypothetical protein G7048_16845 [Diaphorobacter sp. HDW4B]|uniref:hypothetical protein n=1 Tax=Diaphorobacter sp. HDW4B TaxID=2714925 RepID=UPI001408D558|nr:hypothetical protein [Diaphorobacter sp. HDW4B]QIL71876.1 hypothetical protein G7048_16845 [Diaphorobacter sp. HDW4B]